MLYAPLNGEDCDRAVQGIFTPEFARQLASMFSVAAPEGTPRLVPGAQAAARFCKASSGMTAPSSSDRPKDQEDDVIPASLPKPLRRWNAGAAVFAALFVAACTCTTGDGFRITKPTAGEHLLSGRRRAVVT